MQCARLNLIERSKPVVRQPPKIEKPRRYCQKRMINPEHSEDPRWNDVLKRFHCHGSMNIDKYSYENDLTSTGLEDDTVLTVQNLKFQGVIQEQKRPKTSFKFKSLTSNRNHRMFIKQVVDEIPITDEDRSSELTTYYFDDYVNYIISADRSRPSSSKSSIFLQDLSNKYKENKSTQVETKQKVEPKKTRKIDIRIKNTVSKSQEDNESEVNNNIDETMQDAKISFQKTGKRKSLTISRAQSPETIQVIRVDVVCNYSTSSGLSDYEEDKKQTITKVDEKNLEQVKFKTPHFADKYLLTKSIKSVNENLSCGSKVTLLCKTFKLSDRTKLSKKKFNKILKETTPKTKINKK